MNQTLVIPMVSENTVTPQVAAPVWHKGTSGENNARHKITAAQALEIYHSSGPRLAVAKRYGVSVQTVSLIRKGQRWAWLTQAAQS